MLRELDAHESRGFDSVLVGTLGTVRVAASLGRFEGTYFVLGASEGGAVGCDADR
jgi:hypothetical protein